MTKQAFDKSELINEVSRAKKELAFANKKIQSKRSEGPGGGMSVDGGHDAEDIHNSIKLIETINIQKKMLEDENDDLKSRISEMMNDRSGMFQQADSPKNFGYGQQMGQEQQMIRREIQKMSISSKQEGFW